MTFDATTDKLADSVIIDANNRSLRPEVACLGIIQQRVPVRQPQSWVPHGPEYDQQPP
jgi:hypothetical protein